MVTRKDQPSYCFIGAAARFLGVQCHTLRYYEKIGIIEPSRSRGNIRLYSAEDLAYLQRVKALMDELGVSLAGAEVILRMTQQITELQERIKELQAELRRAKRQDRGRGKTKGT